MINLDHDIGRLMITYLELQKKISSCGIKWDVARGYVQQQIERDFKQIKKAFDDAKNSDIPREQSGSYCDPA
jgi:hypothetical protein